VSRPEAQAARSDLTSQRPAPESEGRRKYPLGRNVAANFGGLVSTTIVNIAFIPLYVRLIGIEAYGLVGVFATLQAVFLLFDFGLSPTVIRQLARNSAAVSTTGEVRDFVRTMMAIYLLIGIAVAGVIAIAAPYIAGGWIKVDRLGRESVLASIYLMAAIIAAQWPLALCRSALTGLEHQVVLSAVNAVMSVLRAGAAVAVLSLVQASVELFFASQLVVTIAHLLTLYLVLSRSMPGTGSGRLRPGLLLDTWRFTAGIGGITILATVLTQVDKVAVSAMFPLAVFGYYSLAVVFASGPSLLFTPVFTALFPRLSALVAARDGEGMDVVYHRSCQVLSVIVLPVATVMAIFSHDLVRIWTGSVETANVVAPFASLLVIGTALNGLMHLPYALQLAYGWTTLGFRINALLVVIVVPLAVGLATLYGAVGAAATWAVANALYVIIGIPTMHRRLLPGHAMRWARDDVALPLLGTCAVVALGRMLLPPMGDVALLVVLSLTAGLAAVVATMATPGLRDWAMLRIRTTVSAGHG
jgi:O-antigen/teichoic acid export membrane protein